MKKNNASESGERQERKRFIAMTRLWHAADERYYTPNSEVDLSHLTDDSIRVLIGIGAIRPIEEGSDGNLSASDKS